ncbi:hypothetical protein Tsubulata_036275 [Turnera subulata]|uniref:Glycosyltransferase n=1 Tax=Turnera subulata TaxID=218843 RepID=A0A9Q0FZK5_9ROSI|nr:hypothetical protein Tsubulata_036275 [Turnera subulata]
MEGRTESINVLMLPWLGHGHISPFLELAKKLAERNFHIFFCSTPVNLGTIKDQISQKYSPSIELVELHLPSLPDLPPHYHTTKGLPPHLMPTLKKAFEMASPGFHKIIKSLRPDLLIYDFLQPWAPALASSLNIPGVEFLCCSTVMTCFVKHISLYPGINFPFPGIYLREYETHKFNLLLESSVDGVKDADKIEECFKQSLDVVLVKTFREIEAEYIDYLSDITSKKIVPVGPLVQDSIYEEERKGIIEWLDKKERKSTLFVSFGTEFFLSKEDMEEIAYGLELSMLNFIWVVRFPVGEQTSTTSTTLEASLPEGFLERVGDRGMVVEGWAPQARILEHSSIGGFVSHCGWSSVMESMKNGVPIVAMPMHLDQPCNARLVEDVGVGIEVKRDGNGNLHREEVAMVIQAVVMGEKGESVRKKAKELGQNMINNGDQEIDEAVEELVKLCLNKNCNP